MSNTTYVTFTSARGNVLKTKDVEKAAERFITPQAKPGQSYVESVLFQDPKAFKSGAKYKKVKPITFYQKNTTGKK